MDVQVKNEKHLSVLSHSLPTFLLLLFTLFLHGAEWDPSLGEKKGVSTALTLFLLEASPRFSTSQAIARPLLVQASFRLHSHAYLARVEAGLLPSSGSCSAIVNKTVLNFER